MDILKFALGFRFDLMKDDISDSDVGMILGEVSSVLSSEETAGLHLHGGRVKLSDLDGSGMYALVFMNGSMKVMRNVFLKLDGDAVIKSLLDQRIPYLQNNVIRSFADMTFLGVVAEDGRLSGGSFEKVVFHGPAEDRKPYVCDNAVIISPSRFSGIGSIDAAARLARVFRDEFPGSEIIRMPVPCSDDIIKAFEISSSAERHGMNVTSLNGGRTYAEYLVSDHSTGMIFSPGKSLSESEGSETSAGLGELIRRAAHEGLKEIYVFLDGYETGDKGYGAAKALGCRFMLDGAETATAYPGSVLNTNNADPLLKKPRFFICDIGNVSGNDEFCETLCKALNGVMIDPMQAYFRITHYEELISGHAKLLVTGGKEHDAISRLLNKRGDVLTAYLYEKGSGNIPEGICCSEAVAGVEDLEAAARRIAQKIKSSYMIQ